MAGAVSVQCFVCAVAVAVFDFSGRTTTGNTVAVVIVPAATIQDSVAIVVA